MNYNYTELKKKSVVNIMDGRCLGKITDMVVSFPDGKVTGIIVPGKKNAFFCGNELIISPQCIERIGDDAILVRLCEKPSTTVSTEEYTEE